MKLAAICSVVALAAGCASVPEPAPPAPEVARPEHKPAPKPAPAPGKGAYYKDDGPGDHPPANLASIADAVPKSEALNPRANSPYVRFGKSYVPMTSVGAFRETGIASWYGRRFNGQPTSSGERYDMYAMTAAHPTLPIPSYARVTNLANGRSVVVRVNDRGPFHSDRIIDLSYAAAWKLGYVEAGSARVEVEAVVPEALAAQPEAEPKGVFLQLGAFSGREAAESYRARLYRELGWLSDAVRVVASGALYRLHLGPYRSQDEARSIAERIQSQLNLQPLLLVR